MEVRYWAQVSLVADSEPRVALDRRQRCLGDRAERQDGGCEFTGVIGLHLRPFDEIPGRMTRITEVRREGR